MPVIPYLVAKDAQKAIEFYQKAFNAKVDGVTKAPTGEIMHATLIIAEAPIFLMDENEGCGAIGPRGETTPVSLYLTVPNCDELYAQAVKAGVTSKMAPQDMFWGDRWSCVVDPFGHCWHIATRVEEVSGEECERRLAEGVCQQVAEKQKATSGAAL